MQNILNGSLKQNFVALSALLVIVVVVISATLIINFRSIIQLSDTIKHREIVVLNKAAELKLNVVQVQQWLTDISATRAHGLADGFDEAEKSARRVHQLIAELQQVDAGNAAVYRDMVPAFNDYYEVGKQMAKAYVADGPAGGNRKMSEFDVAAARLAELVDAFVASTKTRADDVLTQQEQLSASAVTPRVPRLRSPRSALRACTAGAPRSAPRTPEPPVVEPVTPEIRQGLWRDCGLIRDAEGLSRLLDSPHLLTQLIARSALRREESRGSHFRSDFPSESEELQRHVVIGEGAEPVLEQWQ